MKKLAMLALTYDQTMPNDTSKWSVSRMYTMEGKSVGPWNGERALHFMNQFDVVVLWHFPAPDVVQIIQQHLNVKVVGALNLADITTYPEWSHQGEYLRKMLTYETFGFLLESKTLNRFGSYRVDAHERSLEPEYEKPHTWAVNTNHPRLVITIQQIIRELFDQYGVDRPDIFIDSHHPNMFYGTASNAPKPAAHGWWAIDTGLAALFCPIWGHDAADVSTCGNTIEEWALRDLDVSDLAHRVAKVKGTNRTITLCPNGGIADWEKLQDLINYGVTPTYIQHARSGMFASPDVDLI